MDAPMPYTLAVWVNRVLNQTGTKEQKDDEKAEDKNAERKS